MSTSENSGLTLGRHLLYAEPRQKYPACLNWQDIQDAKMNSPWLAFLFLSGS